jgi:hypothetical protein
MILKLIMVKSSCTIDWFIILMITLSLNFYKKLERDPGSLLFDFYMIPKSAYQKANFVNIYIETV